MSAAGREDRFASSNKKPRYIPLTKFEQLLLKFPSRGRDKERRAHPVRVDAHGPVALVVVYGAPVRRVDRNVSVVSTETVAVRVGVREHASLGVSKHKNED